MAEHEKKEESSPFGALGWFGHGLSALGKAHYVEHVGPAMGPLGSFLGAVGAAGESYENFHEGRTLDGVLKGGEAVLDAGAGVAETMAMGAGAGSAAGTVGAVLGGAALGIGAGMGMESATKYAGIYHDDHGQAISGAEKAAGWGNALSQWIDPAKGTNVNGGSEDGLLEGNFTAQGARSTFANAAGINASILGSVAGLGMDLFGTGAAIAKGLMGGDEKKPADGAPFAHYAE